MALPPLLLVDDDADDLFFLRRLLAKAEVENTIVAFENPLGAIDYLERESRNPNPLYVPCVILTDFNMPGKNGLELIRWVRAHPQLKQIRVVLLTDSEDPTAEPEALRAGAEAFLRKFPTAATLRKVLGDLPCVGE